MQKPILLNNVKLIWVHDYWDGIESGLALYNGNKVWIRYDYSSDIVYDGEFYDGNYYTTNLNSLPISLKNHIHDNDLNLYELDGLKLEDCFVDVTECDESPEIIKNWRENTEFYAITVWKYRLYFIYPLEDNIIDILEKNHQLYQEGGVIDHKNYVKRIAEYIDMRNKEYLGAIYSYDLKK
ncbi:hypothetical protein LCGC14_1778220 [marine sediment metagenome]|uniref:Uncharacterized protein n=2 Tax=root TaxID=1 RepID=A0A0F9GW42_9ZZZZ